MNQSLENLSKLRLLLEIDGIGPGKLFNLISRFNSLDNLLGADQQSLLSVDGISKNLASRILYNVKKYPSILAKIRNEMEKLHKIGAHWITFWSKDYPKNLKQIFAPPIILYYKGDLYESDINSISIVGTRNPSRYGKTYAEKFAKSFAINGITVVSGMARGIDTFAHKGSLSSNGRTIAILGSGLDVIYPQENKPLFDEISEKGAVISEYPLGTKPDAQNFPKRNRIISGFSKGTLVIETRLKGGAMQTAALALEQNREVFAVPGNLGIDQSEGTNILIQKGEAKLVRNSEDIFIELNLKIKPEIGKNIPKPSMDLNIFEQNIFELISDEPKHIDKISKESKLSSSDCLVHLLSLEFREMIKQLPGKNFVRT